MFGDDDSYRSPLFADGHISMVFSFGAACHADGVWRPSSALLPAKVIGAMSRVGPSSGGDRPEMVGVFFQSGQEFAFTQVPASELTDQIVALQDLWGAAGSEVPEALCETDATARIDRLKAALLGRIGEEQGQTVTFNAPGLAAWVLRGSGRLTVQDLADAAGVSRQHLTRVFRERIGVPPKLYCRLARFQSGLAYAGCGKHVNWAGAALDMGYADQSHMIAEFREFSSLTPETLASQSWFHPFIERAKARQNSSAHT